MSKVIIAICGKSASGKDTLAKWLTQSGVMNNIVSHTTRPPRDNEIDGVDYYFLSDRQFGKNERLGKYVEVSEFRKWKYGTPFDSIKDDVINVGVFNKDGIKALSKYNYKIIPVYLKTGLITRLHRSYDRENKMRLEYFRRAITDFFDFLGIKRLLKRFSRAIILDGEDSTLRNGLELSRYLKIMNRRERLGISL